MRESVRKGGQRLMVGFHGHEASAGAGAAAPARARTAVAVRNAEGARLETSERTRKTSERIARKHDILGR